jgi:uncharacterized protein (TIGR03083 family)
MDTSTYLSSVVAQTDTLAAWVQGQDPTTPVPTCPKWTLADLVDHVGSVQRMVTMLVGERLTDPSPAFAGYVPSPTDSSQWGSWLTGCAAEAADAFATVDDDTAVWDPSGGADGVRFWSRRVFGEVSVHRADAAAALSTPYDLEPDYAVAAVEDWLDTMTSQGYWDNRPDFADAMRGDGQTLHFHATDVPGEWLARREPDQVALERGHAEADVAVRGPATDLLLVLSRRRSLHDATALEVYGDRALLEHWVEHMDWVSD